MPSVDKALLKAAALEELLQEMQAALANSDKNMIGITASRDTVDRLMARVSSYKKKIEGAYEGNVFPPESSEAVYAVFRDILSIVADAHKVLSQTVEQERYAAGGLRKAVQMAQVKVNQAKAVAARAAEQDLEDAREDFRPAAPEPPAGTLLVPVGIEEDVVPVQEENSPPVVEDAPEKPQKKSKAKKSAPEA